MVKLEVAILFIAGASQARGLATTEPPQNFLIGNVSNTRCHGTQSERQVCSDKPCDHTVCKDCKWTDWSAWRNQDGCNGLAYQVREVDEQNNECGAPCAGAFKRTKSIPKPATCDNEDQTCALSQWTLWSACLNRLGQQWRSNAIVMRAHGTGSGCGTDQLPTVMNTTRPCGQAGEERNCSFAEWGEWTSCSKPCGGGWNSRYRRFKHKSTFLGIPCTGKMNEFEICNAQACPAPLPCEWSPWNDWAGCDVTDAFQMVRRRSMVSSPSPALPGMTTCHTAPYVCPTGMIPRQIPGQTSIACTSTGCDDATCCSPNATSTPSPTASTTMSSSITTSTPSPRLLESQASDVEPRMLASREACIGTTRETKPCLTSARVPVDCQLTDWSLWSTCTKTCQGGQQTKYRTLQTPPKYGGSCDNKDLVLTQQCNERPCDSDTCTYTDWSNWGAPNGDACSSQCGPGTNRRFREVKEAKGEKGGCTGAIKEIQPCQSVACAKTDCLWSGWQEWSGCTASCGGGTKRRNQFIKQAPVGGGTFCTTESKAEVHSCSLQVCPSPCVDGVWSAWSGWGSCTKTCGGAYQSRHRTVAVASTPCGQPVSGPFDEFRNCSNNVPCEAPVDCDLNRWGEWSACSASCFGIREKHRNIRTFAKNFGKSCGEDTTSGVLKIVEGCNPSPGMRTPHTCDATPAHDCVLESWSDWTNCPVACGGGQEYRQRHILTPPSHNGKPCLESVAETRPCHDPVKQAPCSRTCIDCTWREWSEWGACTSCNNGQKWRTRNVMAHANYCGKTCEEKAAKEVVNCSYACEDELFCSWTPWTAFETCDSGVCGPSTQKSQRTLHLTNTAPTNTHTGVEDYFFKGKAPLTCSGTQFNNTACPLIKCAATCHATDCAYHGWSDWNYMHCTGLAKRHRQMAVVGRCGGKLCTGNLIESKAVPSTCSTKQDCRWNPWGSWSPCHSAGQQSHRARAVFKMPQMGGKPCNGTMVETKPCVTSVNTAVDCEMQDWFPWSHCSQTCGVGWKMRNRATIPAVNGGALCNGSLKQLHTCDMTNDAACGLAALGVPCAFDGWSDWSMCLQSGQRNRVRHIVTMARFGAQACNGSLEELGTCGPGEVDCSLSQWTSWDTCDVSCGNGQQQRNRQLIRPASGGGIACDMPLVQTRKCSSTSACSTNNCELEDWSQWGACGQTCGSGQSQRSREVKKQRGKGGIGCNGGLHEYKNCTTGTACDVTDCGWADWQAWSTCTLSCDGGQQTRIRIINAHATRGGLPCPVKNAEETQACNTRKCGAEQCTDAQLSEWTPFSACSTTCMGGIKHRSREVKVRANDCGKMVNDTLAEVVACWTPTSCFPGVTAVDCVMHEWTEWSPCSATCQGIATRARGIKTQGKGTGAFCTGSTSEIKPCNPEVGGTLPILCPSGVAQVDCKQTDWSNWGACSKQCGAGQKTRSRTITQPPSLGGNPCPHANMSEMDPCEIQPCTTTEKDCAYSDWDQWSACDSCKGQTHRSRGVSQHPTEKGKPCNASVATMETRACLTGARDCPNTQHYCVWGDWSPYSECHTASGATCGARYKRRTRALKASFDPPVGYVPLTPAPTPAPAPRLRLLMDEDSFNEGMDYEQSQASRLRNLALSFATGGASVGFLMLAARHFGTRSSTSGSKEQVSVAA